MEIYKVNFEEKKIKNIFNLVEIENKFNKRSKINLESKRVLVIFNSEVEFYERNFFQFFNYFFQKGITDVMFLKRSNGESYLEKIDKSKIIYKYDNNIKYDYIFSVGASDLFDKLLLDKKNNAKFILINIGISEEVWEEKNKSNLAKLFLNTNKKKVLDVYTFDRVWPLSTKIIINYYGESLIDIYQQYPLPPLVNSISFNKSKNFFFDYAVIGKSAQDFMLNNHIVDKNVAILANSMSKVLTKYHLNLNSISKNNIIAFFPNNDMDLFKRVILLSKIIILPPTIPSKLSNTCMALGGCLISTHKKLKNLSRFFSNIVFIKNGDDKLINKYLENDELNRRVCQGNVDFAQKHFDLNNFFSMIINNYFTNETR